MCFFPPSFLFPFPMSHVLPPSLSCLQWVTAASETLLRTAVESTSKILSMTHPCKWFTHKHIGFVQYYFPCIKCQTCIKHVSHSLYFCAEWMDELLKDKGLVQNSALDVFAVLWTCDCCHLSMFVLSALCWAHTDVDYYPMVQTNVWNWRKTASICDVHDTIEELFFNRISFLIIKFT